MNLAAVNCIPLDPAVSRGVDPVVVAEFLWNWIKADPDRFQLFAPSFDVDYSANLYDVLCNIFDFKGGKSSAEMEAACSKFLRLWRDGLIDCSDKSNFILDDEVFDQESLKKWFLLNYGQLSAKMRKS